MHCFLARENLLDPVSFGRLLVVMMLVFLEKKPKTLPLCFSCTVHIRTGSPSPAAASVVRPSWGGAESCLKCDSRATLPPGQIPNADSSARRNILCPHHRLCFCLSVLGPRPLRPPPPPPLFVYPMASPVWLESAQLAARSCCCTIC